MGISPISSYSTTRITGLASGMDTDSLIQKAMQAEQTKFDRLYQNRTKLEWKRDAYTDIRQELSDFRNKYMSQLSKDNVFSTNIYRSYKVSMSDSKFMNVTATHNASLSRYSVSRATTAKYVEINGAKYRSRAAQATGTAGVNSRSEAVSSKQLAEGMENVSLRDLKYADGTNVFTGDDAKLAFSVNGASFVFDMDDSLQDVMDAVNSNATAKVKMSVEGGNIRFESRLTGAASKLTLENMVGDNKAFGADGVFGLPEGEVKAKSLISTDMTLAQMEAATGKNFGFDKDGKVSFQINGHSFSFSENDTLDSVMKGINESGLGVNFSYNQEEDTFSLRSTSTGAESGLVVKNLGDSRFFGEYGLTGIAEVSTDASEPINRQSDTIASAASKMGVTLQTDANGKFGFIVNGKEFTFDTSATLQQMMDTVNGDPDAGVRMSYSQITDSFTFSSTKTGFDAKVKVENLNGTNAFGGKDSFFGVEAGETRGMNATITINGETISQSSNSFTLDGIQFDLKQDFDATQDGTIQFSVEQDIDSVVDKVKAFVEDYNKIVQSLNEKISELPDRKYSPLTQDQEDALDEKTIEKWETKAKQGLLRNDSTISNLLSKMRSALFQKVGDTGLSASDIGLSTGAWYNKGQIAFDEDKFRAAMAKDPEKVAQVMAGTSKSNDTTEAYGESGIISRLFDRISDAENTLKNKDIKKAKDAIKTAEDDMDDMLDKMYEQQERLYMQFAMMEKMMQQYQQQSTWLGQQLGAL